MESSSLYFDAGDVICEDQSGGEAWVVCNPVKTRAAVRKSVPGTAECSNTDFLFVTEGESGSEYD